MSYASKSLADAETIYVQIEKELLSILFACEKFNQYIYGQLEALETDHKPLIALFSKPWNDCTLQIQQVMIKLQKYDLTMTYTPGKRLFAADVLFQAIPQEKNNNYRANVDMIITSLLLSIKALHGIKDATHVCRLSFKLSLVSDLKLKIPVT